MRKLFELIASFIALFARKPAEPSPQQEPLPSPPSIPVTGVNPPWYDIALEDLGIAEIPGSKSNPDIMRAWQYVPGYKPTDDSVDAWCSAKANEWMGRAGHVGTGKANARSWLTWGRKLDIPRLGAVVVFWRGSPSGWQGHVALYVGPGKDGKIMVLGGNQSNKVSVAEYPANQVLGYRWPSAA